MRIPIKLNRSFWLKSIGNLVPSADDPRVLLRSKLCGEEFSKAVSVLKFGDTFKTTSYLRFPKTSRAITALEFPHPPVVLDIGASDGSASSFLIQNLTFKKFFLTDLNMVVFSRTQGGKTYFYDLDMRCILIVTKLFVVYPDPGKALFPFDKIASAFFPGRDDACSQLKRIELINPGVKSLKRNIVIETYDVFSKWTRERADLIIAANILNRSYFSETQITRALENIMDALNDRGRLAIADSRMEEKSTVFRIEGNRMIVEKDINGGTEIRGLVLKARRGKSEPI